jgi:hypothetical protein
VNLIVLKGFSSHGDYWGDDGEAPDDNVFDLLVPKLFAGTTMLA